ncbi:MAG: acyl-CoA thioesterase [Candidatus Spyradosoma sp.]
MLQTTATTRVRFSETDAMGVVYHANYLPWCEVARTRLLAEVGLPYARLQELGFLLPVLEINLKYRAPARFGDVVSVRARMEEMPRVRIRIDYEIFRGDGELLTTGHSLHAFMNREGVAIKPPAFFLETLRAAFDAREGGAPR